MTPWVRFATTYTDKGLKFQRAVVRCRGWRREVQRLDIIDNNRHEFRANFLVSWLTLQTMIKVIDTTGKILALVAVNIVLANGKIFFLSCKYFTNYYHFWKPRTCRGVPRTHPGVIGKWKTSLVRGETIGDSMQEGLHAKTKFWTKGMRVEKFTTEMYRWQLV